MLEALLAIRIAGHKPLAQTAPGIAEDQRDATY